MITNTRIRLLAAYLKQWLIAIAMFIIHLPLTIPMVAIYLVVALIRRIGTRFKKHWLIIQFAEAKHPVTRYVLRHWLKVSVFMRRHMRPINFLEMFGIVLLLLFFFPFSMVIFNSAKSASEIITTPLTLPNNWLNLYYNIVEILGRRNIDYFRAFFNSVVITSVSLIAIGIFSAMAAWVLVRTKTKYSFWIFMFFLTGLVIPFQVVMLPLVRLLETLRQLTGIQFKDTYHGVILAYVGFGAPLSVFLFHGFIKSIPLDIEEAAIIDGCTRAQVFFKVVLPILKPIFVTLLVLNGMWIWNDYLLPVLVIGLNGNVKTLPLSVANLAGFYDKEWALILTSVLMAALPVLILFFFAQRHIIRGMTSGAIK